MLGPRSSGKTALLKAVLSDSVAAGGFPPIYLDGRSRQLTDAGVLVRLLQEEGEKAVQRLLKLGKNSAGGRLGRVFRAVSAGESYAADAFSISGEQVVETFLRGQDQSLNDVIGVYDEMLALYKSDRAASDSWPVICIDEANVLTQWQQGSLEKRESLSALLRFFVMVCKCARSYGVLGWHNSKETLHG